MSAAVVLCSAPVMSVLRPSIALGLLQAGVAQRGIAVESLYLNLTFAEWIGVDLNERLAEDVPAHLLAGDWIFAPQLGTAADRAAAERHERALDAFLHRAGIAGLRRLREQIAPRFVDAVCSRILQRRPAIVGFSTMFQQTAASLAIAAAVKRQAPSVTVCFGGANCHGPMGAALLRCYPQIDYVFTGEADLDFPAFAAAVLTGGNPADSARGFVGRAAATAPAAPLTQLDLLPVPDYRDYFDQLAGMAEAGRIRPSLPFETSRGCWWGQKHHCTFCGLNAEGMVFREKSGDRALDELGTLRRTHGIGRFAATDNIMSMRHVTTLMKPLADAPVPSRLFYEVKSNLDAATLEMLGRAGVSWLQPGIESLSDAVLRIMRKGVSALLNIRLMRMCRELGIGVTWTILHGFPGEPPEAYAEMAARIPAMEHLHPPNGCSRIRLDRFSPNFERAAELGFRSLRPVDAYRAVFAAAAGDVDDLAYFFEGDADAIAGDADLAALREAVAAWRAAWFEAPVPPQLGLVRVGAGALIMDTRRIALAPMHYLEPAELALLDRLHDPVGMGQLTAAMMTSADGARQQQALDRLVDLHMVVRIGDRVMSLVVEAGREVVSEAARNDFPLGYLCAPEPPQPAAMTRDVETEHAA